MDWANFPKKICAGILGLALMLNLPAQAEPSE